MKKRREKKTEETKKKEGKLGEKVEDDEGLGSWRAQKLRANPLKNTQMHTCTRIKLGIFSVTVMCRYGQRESYVSSQI